MYISTFAPATTSAFQSAGARCAHDYVHATTCVQHHDHDITAHRRYIYIYIPTYIHTCVLTYMNTYIRTCQTISTDPVGVWASEFDSV